VRRNFLCGLQGREPDSLSDLNAQLREWIWGVANQRVHGTKHEQVMVRWDVEQFSLQSLAGQPPYPYVDGELRKVVRDAYVDWRGSRYSVPWQYAGQVISGRAGKLHHFFFCFFCDAFPGVTTWTSFETALSPQGGAVKVIRVGHGGSTVVTT
jgi:hypothetical protein